MRNKTLRVPTPITHPRLRGRLQPRTPKEASAIRRVFEQLACLLHQMLQTVCTGVIKDQNALGGKDLRIDWRCATKQERGES